MVSPHSLFLRCTGDRFHQGVHTMKGCGMLHKVMLLSVFFIVSTASTGCISIRNASPNAPFTVENCRDHHGCQAASDDCCESCDQPDGIRRLASTLKPAAAVPKKVIGIAQGCKDRTAAWMSNQCGRCYAAKSSLHDWIQAKREEANAPPWPRFHPIPTQNVFAPQPSDQPDTPEVYGRFGKG